MAGGVLRDDLGVIGRREPLAVAQVFGALESERVERRPHELGERGRSGCMILMVVRHEHRRDPSRGARNLVAVFRVVRTGVDDDRRVLADDPRVRSLQRVHARVRCQDANDPQQSRQSCQNVARGRRSTSSSVGSRVSNRRASRSATDAHSARWVSVKNVGQ